MQKGQQFGSGVTLEKRSGRDSSFRFGSLAWSGERHDLAYLTAAEFTRSFEVIRPSISRSADLILCAGRQVYWNSRRSELRPEEVLDRTGGVPVLYEWWELDKDERDRAEWRIIHAPRDRPTVTVLRNRQLVGTSADKNSRFARLAEAVASGAGIIRFEGVPVNILLLICGENNCVKLRQRRSVMRGVPRTAELGAALRDTFASEWLLLNPAHSPYWPRILRTGAGNVFTVHGRIPTFAQLVAEERRFGDGTIAPIGVLHANTYIADGTARRHPTAEVSILAFSRFARGVSKLLEPIAVTEAPCGDRGCRPQIVDWRYAEFRFPY